MSVEIQERRIAAVVGALVADAAAQPIHWVYDVKKLDSALSGVDDVGFREPSINPFYRLPTGSQSCYADQALVILKSLVECQGVDVENLRQQTYNCFGPESPYEDVINAGYKIKTDLGSSKYPIFGPWRHFSIKDFIKNYDAGKDSTGSSTDEQIDCILRIVPVVALYAGMPQMLEKAEEVIRVTQNSDTCVAIGLAAARLLEYFIEHGPSPDAVEKLIEQLSAPDRRNPQDLDKAIVSFLREVLRYRGIDHITAARKIKID